MEYNEVYTTRAREPNHVVNLFTLAISALQHLYFILMIHQRLTALCKNGILLRFRNVHIFIPHYIQPIDGESNSSIKSQEEVISLITELDSLYIYYMDDLIIWKILNIFLNSPGLPFCTP